MAEQPFSDIVIEGATRLNELVRNMSRSTLLQQEHPKAISAVLSIHQRMTHGAGQGVAGDPDAVNLRGLAETYGVTEESSGKLLRLLNEAVAYSAPLSQHHPDRSLQEFAVHEDRLDLMTFLADNNPSWLRAYQNMTHPAAPTRRERAALSEAFGGPSVGASPINRLLANAGELIDLMEQMDDTSAQYKAKWLAAEYDRFEEQYGFDPATITITQTVEESPDGPVTQSRISRWDALQQKEEKLTISTAPGGNPMPRSRLMEAAAQRRWEGALHDPEAKKDVATFCRAVLERSLPERMANTPTGKRMEYLGIAVEETMGRHVPAELESWKQRDVLSTYCVPKQSNQVEEYFAQNGLSTGITDNQLVAATPEDAAIPRLAKYYPAEGMLIMTEYGSSTGLKKALSEDWEGEPRRLNQYARPAMDSPRAQMERKFQKACHWLDKEQINKVIDLLCGESVPESVPEVSAWLRQCYNWPSQERVIERAANALMDGHGIEYIRAEEIGDGSGGELIYINMGDPYIPTLNWYEGSLYLAGQGDMVEAIEQQQLDEREGRDWSQMSISNPHPMPDSLDELIDQLSPEIAEPEYHEPFQPSM